MFSCCTKLKSIVFTGLMAFSQLSLTAQENVLFTIAGNPVDVKEFEYVYNKNNFNNSADYSEKSLTEYLTLFTNYKLKVKEALTQRMDTLPVLKREYEGYEQQLFDNYLNKQVLEKLIKQEYERSQSDVFISHIFIKADAENASAKIDEVYQKLKSGANFSETAAQYSQDDMSKNKGGDLGYFTALQIGFPQLEDVIYNTPKGSFSTPVKTPIGYHIVKVNDIRPARGRIKIAVIKILLENGGSEATSKAKIDSIYAALKNGADFKEMVQTHSEDYSTYNKGGEMDWFGINTYAPVIEEAAFALQKDGDIAEPVKTSTAWYIVKRISRTSKLSFDEAESVLRAKLLKSKMYAGAMQDFIDKKKAEYGWKESTTDIENFKKIQLAALSDNRLNYISVSSPKVLFAIAGKQYDENTIGTAMSEFSAPLASNLGKEALIEYFYSEAVKNAVLDEVKKRLPSENFEYKALLEEYKNGVLIFELSRENVWEKATQDSIGLRKYYEENKNNYLWNDRAVVYKFTPDAAQLKVVEALIKKNKKLPFDQWSVKLSQSEMGNVKAEELKIEKDKSDLSTSVSWKPGEIVIKDNVIYFTAQILPPTPKAFEECRGYVIAAYQEKLEKNWLDVLKVKYPVEINTQVLKSLVKK